MGAVMEEKNWRWTLSFAFGAYGGERNRIIIQRLIQDSEVNRAWALMDCVFHLSFLRASV